MSSHHQSPVGSHLLWQQGRQVTVVPVDLKAAFASEAPNKWEDLPGILGRFSLGIECDLLAI